MRRYFILLLLVFILISCSEKTEEPVVVEEEPELKEEKNYEDQTVEEKLEQILEVPKELDDETILKELEKTQQEIFMERADVLKQKRELLDKINSRETSFEDRQFYQKALDLVKVRESELTLEVSALDGKINSIKIKVENAELIEALQNQVQDMQLDRNELVDELIQLGDEIYEVRKQGLEKTTSEYITWLIEELRPLEQKELDLLNKFENINNDINKTNERLADLTGDEIIDETGLLLEKFKISQALNVVRNELVSLYLKEKTATGADLTNIKKQKDQMKDKENDLESQLMEIERQLN